MSEWPTLTMFSVPMLSSWTFAEQYRLLVDCGDGAASTLGSKIHKIDVIALTHAHRDHIAGLLQVLNLRGGGGNLRVVYPEGSGSFPALGAFLSEFDAETSGKVEWISVNSGDSFELRPGQWLEVFTTNHIPTTGLAKSIGYRLVRKQKKLRPEFVGKGSEIPNLINQLGEEAMFDMAEVREIAFCGDGLPMDSSEVAGLQCMVVECTFLEPGVTRADHIHADLDQVGSLLDQAKPERAILNHISIRYSTEEIMEKIGGRSWPCPIEVVFPGVVKQIP